MYNRIYNLGPLSDHQPAKLIWCFAGGPAVNRFYMLTDMRCEYDSINETTLGAQWLGGRVLDS